MMDKKVKLSILIPTVPRRKEYLKRLLSILYKQKNDSIEIIILEDEYQDTLWVKRNKLLESSKWEYVVFVDDDDRVSDDYVETLLEWIKSKADVINFKVIITIDWWDPKEVIYSKELTDYFDWTKYYRRPNHIMCFRKDIAIKEPYKDINFWEDSDYSERIQKHINSELNIDKILYFYEYLSNNSECKN